ncbi:NAD(P)-binding protein [Hypoxylon trugodes]|uniref:NAD(P)-binding protein n=1 Tax=Hypoxylon trugodes TaxID=326681 RepID=UPI00219C9B99|nr:NAD(P)-binding protein [Hypoxylon trugodes]KAI1392684.1 NAD(P)-binding protein [Hypoxylon trugodes]
MALIAILKNAFRKPIKTTKLSDDIREPVTDVNLVINPGSLVVVTGVNGYVASHIADQLLQRGYLVRGTVRNVPRDQWLKDYFDEKYGKERFELIEVPDMAVAGAFDKAAKGASGFVHTAAPIMSNPDPHATISTVVQSTIGCLESAARESSMKRVVLTSSSGACITPRPLSSDVIIDANTWNEASIQEVNAMVPPYEGKDSCQAAYYASKTKGEQAAWQWVKEHNPSFTLNSVLPNANFGRPLDAARQGSRSTINWVKVALEDSDSLEEKVPGMVPQFHVDVRDDAALHIVALIFPDVRGERLLASANRFNWNDILGILRKLYPDRYILAKAPHDGRDESKVANERAEELLKRLTGNGWISLEESLKDSVEGLGLA